MVNLENMTEFILILLLMKKYLIVTLLAVVSLASLPVLAYDVQPGDNALLTKVYDRIDEVYQEDHSKLVEFLDVVLWYELRSRPTDQSEYFLAKIKEYTHGKLYMFEDSSAYICINDRVQIGDALEVDYILTNDDGEIINLPNGTIVTTATQKLGFNAWRGQLIQWFDHDMLWKQVWITYGVEIAPSGARGLSQQSMMLQLPTAWVLANYPQIVLWDRIAMNVTFDRSKTQTYKWLVIDIDAEMITVDFNHPLAWQRMLGTYTIDSLFKTCKIAK